ncbi:MAG: NUDIX hydrolase [Betaproteobacteria bacterium]|nr:NUDIX hydrolase [Betaproteobacteria bacterium]
MRKNFTESTLATRTVYSGRLLTVKEDDVQLPDGTKARREYVEHSGAVMILPLFEDFSVLLERQFRYPLRSHMLELPAGKIEPGEDTLNTAKRELLEETGYVAGQWSFMSALYPCVGYSNEKTELFLARDLRHEGHPGEEGEFIETARVPLDEALGMVQRAEIGDPKTMLGLLWAEKMRRGEWE